MEIPCDRFPTDDEVEVGIHFNRTAFTKEQQNKLFKIEKLFSELGIHFDTGADCNQRDWEWDWSLKGPVHVTFKRMVKDNQKNRYRTIISYTD